VQALLCAPGGIAAQLVGGADGTIIALDLVTHRVARVAHRTAHAILGFYDAQMVPTRTATVVVVGGALASGKTVLVPTTILTALGKRGSGRGGQGQNGGDADDVWVRESHVFLLDSG
jgi:hypothetical protein